eukprot:NODE_7117_length_1607_cov_3.979054.p6 GENE.NODE_7117_length_1607_cov_3.979054~~NODE_7117_length_1607_cov_3.979054.p6  ORF type:complete len:67 (-),score=10.77 NODE_7117_length_1607_cov_3.979054:231-431(-)
MTCRCLFGARMTAALPRRARSATDTPLRPKFEDYDESSGTSDGSGEALRPGYPPGVRCCDAHRCAA